MFPTLVKIIGTSDPFPLYPVDVSTSEVEIWECEPLVIEGSGGEILFAGRCRIEFAPDSPERFSGTAVAPDLLIGDREVRMTVDEVLPSPPSPVMSIFYGKREGRTLYGHDAEGNSFTWYVNSDADRAILRHGVPH